GAPSWVGYPARGAGSRGGRASSIPAGARPWSCRVPPDIGDRCLRWRAFGYLLRSVFARTWRPPTLTLPSPSWEAEGMCSSLPAREGHPPPRSGLRAVRRDVVDEAHGQLLRRARGGDPVADLRVPRFELGRGQGHEPIRILLGEQIENVTVQLLVHEEVAEPTRGEHGHAPIARPCLHRHADGPAELVAALRRRLVGRVVGVEEHGHDGPHPAPHDALVHEAPRVPEGAVPGLHAHVGYVELEVVGEHLD